MFTKLKCYRQIIAMWWYHVHMFILFICTRAAPVDVCCVFFFSFLFFLPASFGPFVRSTGVTSSCAETSSLCCGRFEGIGILSSQEKTHKGGMVQGMDMNMALGTKPLNTPKNDLGGFKVPRSTERGWTSALFIYSTSCAIALKVR